MSFHTILPFPPPPFTHHQLLPFLNDKDDNHHDESDEDAQHNTDGDSEHDPYTRREQIWVNIDDLIVLSKNNLYSGKPFPKIYCGRLLEGQKARLTKIGLSLFGVSYLVW